MRKRRYTETFGCLITVEEREIVLDVLKARQLTPTQYLREVAVKPLVAAAQEGKDTDGPQD
jgi:hypothetical protein